ncbi:MAG: hypothetical protein G01um1014106_66 [Parcubacteria group bacterium Gr01-1014_106]|nr:MAG: hypothetical protein G01um1014106_66 [Parcubacteria group bacterium Gr01-1014_106]
MHPHSKREQRITHTSSSRGDTSILLISLLLIVLVLGATALTVLSIVNLRGAGNVAESSQALYAADTGVERGLSLYWWSNPLSPTCTQEDNVPVGDAATYQLTVRSDTDSCPTLLDLQGGVRALCVEAIGKVRDGEVRRRVTNDTNPTGLLNPCGR